MRGEKTTRNKEQGTRNKGLAMIVACLLIAGCVPHVRPYTPKQRTYREEKYSAAADVHEDGSIWIDGDDSLFTQRRSSRVGDLITILIKETADAARNAGTDTSRQSQMSLGINSFVTAMSALKSAYPSLDPSKLLDVASQNNFSGKGATTSSGSLSATLTARIKRVLPNGDLYFEGHKVVMVNEEESHLYVSGVVRPSDIQADNTVGSDVVADAQIEYTGRGPVSDKQKPGWFARLLDMINPF